LDPIATSHGWYDLTLNLESDASYLRRSGGHLENGQPSRTRP
jgi:phospholipase C